MNAGGWDSRPVVVKIGGSLLACEAGDTPPAVPVLELVAASGAPVVVVPGGGAFADAVRISQHRLGLGDAACHAMALLAMSQSGLALADLAGGRGRFVIVQHRDAMEAALRQGGVPIWDPVPMAVAAETLGTDWTVTSDSLAAWLASEIGARAVVLVKSCPVPDAHDAEALAGSGVVDRCFPGLVRDADLTWHLVHHSDRGRLIALLAAGRAACTPRPANMAIPVDAEASLCYRATHDKD